MTSRKKALIEIIAWVFIGYMLNVLIYTIFSFLFWENLFEHRNFWRGTRVFITIGFTIGCVRGWLIIKHRK